MGNIFISHAMWSKIYSDRLFSVGGLSVIRSEILMPLASQAYFNLQLIKNSWWVRDLESETLVLPLFFLFSYGIVHYEWNCLSASKFCLE